MVIPLLKFIDLKQMRVGCGIFVREDVPCQVRNDLCGINYVYECVFIKIDKEYFHKEKISLGPPGNEMQIFNENMSYLLNALKNENKYCYLMGDYIINLLNYGKHKETGEFVDLIHSYSFISLKNKPTRLASQNATLIDNIFTNCYNNIENTFQCFIVSDVSNHCPIIHVDYSSKGAKT